MNWTRNRFVQAKSLAELRQKVAKLEEKGWQVKDFSTESPFCCAYLEYAGGIKNDR